MKGSCKRWSTILVVGCALLVCGCATPDSRIKKHPELFDSFPPETQEEVRQGRVHIGFSQDMVFIALGKADREYTRRTAGGVTEVWSYTAHYTSTSRQLVDGRFRVRDSRGQIQTVRDSVWVDVPVKHEYERLRLEFRDGVVYAIEEMTR